MNTKSRSSKKHSLALSHETSRLRRPMSAALYTYWNGYPRVLRAAPESPSFTCSQKRSQKVPPNDAKPLESIFPRVKQITSGTAVTDLVNTYQDLKRARSAYQTKLDEALTRAYVLALTFKHSHDDWLEFCQQPVWQSFKGRRPVPSDRNDTLRFVLRFLAGFNGASATRRANRYIAALRPAFEDELSPAKLPHYIRKGGGIVALSRSNKRCK
jgi:hypothetical protein